MAHASEICSLSIVLPAWNERNTVVCAVRAALAALDVRGIAGEVIIVDDGSADGTGEEVARAFGGEPRVRLIRHPRNLGYGAALMRGVRESRFGHVFWTDADLQFDVRELSRLEDALRENDAGDLSGVEIVVGYREHRADPLHRKVNAWAWNQALRFTLDVGVRDVDCAFKLFARRVFDHINITTGGAFINGEILVRARRAGFRVAEVPVSHFPRRSGAASGARPAVIYRAFVDLARFCQEAPRPDHSADLTTSR